MIKDRIKRFRDPAKLCKVEGCNAFHIANSDFYRHSILGLNIAATGKQKKHRGKTYTLWETTSKYFKIGTLSPSQDDITHWNIVLTNK